MLSKILPQQGLICTAEAMSSKSDSWFDHEFFETLAEAQKYIDRKDAAGRTMFVAQASFLTDKNRTQPNASHVRSFWLDIDCGPGKPYATQAEGGAALKKFCKDTGLPMPNVVNSGYGLYAHWCLSEDVPAAEWKTVARVLKALTKAHEIEVDQSRTADSSSVLRPVGAHNRKIKCTDCGSKVEKENQPCSHDDCGGKGVVIPKQVSAIFDGAAPLTFAGFSAIVLAAAEKKKVSATAPPKPNNLNAEFLEGLHGEDTKTADATLIADKCTQVNIMRQTKGDIEEPLWYANIGLLRYTKQAPEIIHEWSNGEHGMYSAEATDQKIKQSEESGTGPITCHHFGEINPRGCLGCPHKDKIKTPLILGRVVQAVEVGDGIEPPEPFIRATDGLYMPVEGINERFYPHDLYVDSVSFDESLGTEVISIRHTLPQEGDLEFTIQSSALCDVKAAMKELFNNHVTVVGGKEKKMMTAYLESYTEKIKRKRKIKQLLCQMGWRDTDEGLQFVLGEKMFKADGTMTTVSLAKNIPQSARAFKTKGEMHPWIEATRVFAEPGMEALSFAFLVGAFGAPLMRFTGYSGAMVSMLGASGIGKTLIGRWALSAYGEPDTLIMHKDDTKNALVNRLGVYNTLPLYIDEITNTDAEGLSDLAYRITQGRDRVRLNQNAVEKAAINQWNTLALVSSNSSLIDKLSLHKIDAGAEINRVFEIPVEYNPALNRERATRVYRVTSENYGLVGQEYVRYLAKFSHIHRDQIDAITSKIDARTGASSEERFWSAVAACAIYGGQIAKNLGLIEFEIAPLINWLVETIESMRSARSEVNADTASILGRFLDEHSNNQIIVGNTGKPIYMPKGQLITRVEAGSPFIYISRSVLRDWVGKNYGSYSTMKKDLKAWNAIRGDGVVRKVLSQGTGGAGAQVYCMEINMSVAELGGICEKVEQEIRSKVVNIEDYSKG